MRLPVLALLLSLASAELIIKQPLSGKTGPEKLLIIVNGAFVSNDKYVEVGEAIQAASAFKLWLALPSFIADTPNPGEMSSKLAAAVSAVKAANFTTIKATEDVYVSGHSLGGIMSQSEVAKGKYKALVLFGSYLTSTFGNSIANFKYPVLTLAGELDGLTRITRIGHEWQGMQARIKSDGADAVYKYPVFALPGQSHSQFCSGVNVTSFGTKDLRPEVSWESAHEAIGASVSAFMVLVEQPTDSTARNFVDTRVKYTQGLLQGWLAAQAYESEVCAAAQKVNAANVTAQFEVTTKSTGNFASFDANFPVVNKDGQIVVVDELQHLSLKWDQKVSWNWLVVLSPIWLVHSLALALLVKMRLAFSSDPDMASDEDEDEAAKEERKKQTKKILGGTILVLVVMLVFEIILSLKLQDYLDVSWFLVLALYLCVELLLLLARASTATLSQGLGVSLWWGLLRCCTAGLVASKASGQLSCSWMLCVTPMIVGAALKVMWACRRPAAPSTDSADPEEPRPSVQGQVLVALCSVSGWLATLCLAAGKLDGEGYSAFIVLLPYFIVASTVLCCCGCMACCAPAMVKFAMTSAQEEENQQNLQQNLRAGLNPQPPSQDGAHQYGTMPERPAVIAQPPPSEV